MLCEHQQQYPHQRLVLLSGDIHIGCAHQIRWHSGSVLYQLISSPITYETSALVQVASKLLIRCNRSMAVGRKGPRGKVKLLKGEGDMARNPCGGLNLGLVEIETPDPQAPSKLRFYLYGHEGDEPVCRFRSALL